MWSDTGWDETREMQTYQLSTAHETSEGQEKDDTSALSLQHRNHLASFKVSRKTEQRREGINCNDGGVVYKHTELLWCGVVCAVLGEAGRVWVWSSPKGEGRYWQGQPSSPPPCSPGRPGAWVLRALGPHARKVGSGVRYAVLQPSVDAGCLPCPQRRGAPRLPCHGYCVPGLGARACKMQGIPPRPGSRAD